MKTISIINLKGGVAKTLTADNMAHVLAVFHKKRVLLVDNDKQGNTSKAFGVHSYDEKSLSDVLTARRMDVREVIKKTRFENIDVLPASTIYREIKRARWQYLDGDTWIVEDRYNPDGAEKRYRENLAAKGAPLKIGNDYELADYIERKILDEDRSPAAALADIKLEGKAFKTSICVSTLYSYITKGVFLSLTNADLPEKPKRKRPYRTVKKTGKRQNGKSIDKRPEIVDQRTTFGHWEGDTVYSKKDGSKALLVLTERLTRWEIIARIKDRTANSVIKALDQIERRFGADLFAKAFQTITFDNGGEFSDVERLERSAVRKGRRRTTAYFCHPYSSYERGSNECQNKMIRRKLPKGTDFGAVSAAAVKRAEDWINNYPREILGWKTAEICFRECLAALT